MISNCGHDENGSYAGGKAGDQTGNEWAIISWYNRPWNYVLRHPDRTVGNMLAELARKAAQNNLVGYDQNQRGTYWQHLKASNYDPAQITIACEADCSSGVAANVKAAGYRLGRKELQNVSADCYTGNLRAALKTVGFEVLTDKKYLNSPDYLLPGDILLYEGHHTATNLDTGSKVASSTSSPGKTNSLPSYKNCDGKEIPIHQGRSGMIVRAGDGLNVRATPNGPKIVKTLPGGSSVKCDRRKWYYGTCWFHLADNSGWVSGDYLEGWIKEESDGEWKWWYLLKGWNYPKSTHQEINGAMYVFDKDGWMLCNQEVVIDGQTYHLESWGGATEV